MKGPGAACSGAFSLEEGCAMTRTTVAVLIAMLCAGLSAMAVDIRGDLFSVYSPLNNVNAVIEQYELSGQGALSEMHVGTGGSLVASLRPVFGSGMIYVGGRTAFYSVMERDAEIRASFAGGIAGVAYELGRWCAAFDLGIYRGKFQFERARYPACSGWSGGAMGCIGYGVAITSSISAGASVLVNWIPFQRMTDGQGQTYRGRGTPFVDFRGVGASIHLVWEFGGGSAG